MELVVDSLSLTIAQMGPDFVLLDAPVDHPPGRASLVLQVDAACRTWPIQLPAGISASSDRVAIAPAV